MTNKDTQSVRDRVEEMMQNLAVHSEQINDSLWYMNPNLVREALRIEMETQAAAILAELEELPAKTIHGDISRKEAQSIVKKHLL